MYEIFAKLMKAKGCTAYQVAKETGIAQSTLSDWKNGKSVPKAEKIQKIADYFGVSAEYLMTGQEPDSTANPNVAYLRGFQQLQGVSQFWSVQIFTFYCKFCKRCAVF